jgi:hypothetical protein
MLEFSIESVLGNVVRIAPNSIIISDPDVSRDVLAVGSKFKRGPWFDSLRLNPCASNVVSQRNPAIHQEMRAMLAPGVSFRVSNSLSTY